MRALFLLLLFFAFSVDAAEDPPRLAERGVESYRAGRMDLARLFFERAYRQATLQGRADWAARAVCNLVDIAVEMRELEEAGRWLEEVGNASGQERVLVLWKRSQWLNALHRFSEAAATVDSALALGSGDGDLKLRMELDRFRYRFSFQDSTAWNAEFAQYVKELRSSERNQTVGLQAWSRMRRRDYGVAESLWTLAIANYRSEHRLLAVGEALAHRALCLHALDRKAEALRSASQAEGVFEEMGFVLGKLRTQALCLLLQDADAVAKSGREIDFLSRERLGEDWKDLLDDYAQSYPPLLGQLELLQRR